jgi:hypothetical protein
MMYVRVWPRSAGREVTVELVYEDTVDAEKRVGNSSWQNVCANDSPNL